MATGTIHGWIASAKDKPLEWGEQPRKTFDDDTVEMDITHCGICASDLFTLDSGWGKTDYPTIVGHEIAGIVTKVGNNVKNVKVGDRAGVGAQCMSCLQCYACQHHHENICENGVIGTYNGRWPKTNEKTYGGYADVWSGHYNFVFKIPDNLPNEVAATFFCAGITTYAPMKRHGIDSDSTVGVIGIVIALSHSDRKRGDAEKLGCHDFVVTEDETSMSKIKNKLTHIICTSFGTEGFDWGKYLGLLKPGGVFIMVAIPDKPFENIPPGSLVGRQLTLAGSVVGSPDTIREMLAFAAEKGVRPWIEKRPMKQCPETVQAMRDGKARYRFVLEN
ncbi:nad-and zn-dependent alcohol dehydrogenase [Lichtheimia corymbifera JMRC:FSU:9682]|uniref:Nad-and zn-dependent alcohol dehydrogenase n=1 Tax=Lichtheimia corymbifera JMRC:FSU:9682 TaxID=1263082 RepID=A0A068RVJ0_9FUNG|nr:nad-and zn-dependent alcohol dehydrogenase [Lichtheimia corymbifera JMRC:FSU:9682]